MWRIERIVRAMVRKYIRTEGHSTGLLFDTEVTLEKEIEHPFYDNMVDYENYGDNIEDDYEDYHEYDEEGDYDKDGTIEQLRGLNKIVFTCNERMIDRYLKGTDEYYRSEDKHYEEIDPYDFILLYIDASALPVYYWDFKCFVNSNTKNLKEIQCNYNFTGCSEEILQKVSLHTNRCAVARELQPYVSDTTVHLCKLDIKQFDNLKNVKNMRIITTNDALPQLQDSQVYNFLYNLDAAVTFDLFYYSNGFEEVTLAALSLGIIECPVRTKEKRLILDATDRGNYKRPPTEVAESTNYRSGTMKELARQLFPLVLKEKSGGKYLDYKATYWGNKHLEKVQK